MRYKVGPIDLQYIRNELQEKTTGCLMLHYITQRILNIIDDKIGSVYYILDTTLDNCISDILYMG